MRKTTMEPKIADLLAQSQHRVDVCVAFALLWIAAADGSIDANSRSYLNQQLRSMPDGLKDADRLLAAIAANDLDSFLVACRILQQELEQEEKNFFLELAIGTASVNRELTTSSNHILRLYGDLLGFSADELRALYRKVTSTELPEPGDPSSVLWWQVREERASHEDGSANYQHSPGRRFSRAEAYAILGLEKEASRAEVKRAYRRLVQTCHPDRHVSLGPEAWEAAEDRFLRVQQAYEVLNQ